MNIQCIFSFLVHPSKGIEPQPEISGTEVPRKGRLYSLLKDVFDRSDRECKIEISFNPSLAGTQQNECRDEILTFLQSPDLHSGRVVASRLQSVTTRRSGLGLVFLILGTDDKKHKVMISRFPADYGILAEEGAKRLLVKFLEKVFMRNAKSYKAVVYEGPSLQSGFWGGTAVDRQTNSGMDETSHYWIRDFLLSDFKTTSAAGTRRLARALLEAMRSTADVSIRAEIAAAARLGANLDGQTMTLEDFVNRFSFSSETRGAVVCRLRHPSLRFERFRFSREEFGKCIAYKSIELNTGAMLSAPVGKFDECFAKNPVAAQSDEFVFSTKGRIVDEKLRRNR